MPDESRTPATASSHAFGTAWEEDRFDGLGAWTGMQRVFIEASAARPGELCDAWFAFAGRPVHLRVVGRELFSHIVKPFWHLRCGAVQRPELTLELWDDGAIGSLPAPERAEGRTLWREKTLRTTDDRFVAQQLPHTMSCLDRDAGRLVAGIAWHDEIFIYERCKPLARLLLAWYNDREIQIVHAGLVARNGTGVLIAGKSGSGKSTSALVSVTAGLDYLGEDYVGLESASHGRFLGHSVYNSVFLKSTHLARFPEVAPHAINGRPPEEEKSVLILSQVFPERLARSALIRAIAFPCVDGESETQLKPMSKGEALLALAPSSLLQIPNRHLGAAGFRRLAQLVEGLPCYRMSVGTRLGSIPGRLAEIIDRAGDDGL